MAKNPFKLYKPRVSFGLYSKAEEIAYQMPQAKQLGSDAKRYFLKQGVTKDEMDALGLTELFKQKRVTQQEIVDSINENRIELEEKNSSSEGYVDGPDIDYSYEDLSLYDAEDSYFIEEMAAREVDYLPQAELEEVFNSYIQTEYVKPDDPVRETFQEFIDAEGNREQLLDDLPLSVKQKLLEVGEESYERLYNENPQRIIEIVVDGQDTGVRLYGNEDIGFYPHFGDQNFRRFFDSNAGGEIYDQNEAEVFMRGFLEEYDPDLMYGSGDGTKWQQYTLNGGDNYQEYRFSLDAPETKFQEDVHFSDDVNNIFHIRTTDRITPEGEKILFVEELQSDWAQKGRKKGFRNPVIERALKDDLDKYIDPRLEEFFGDGKIFDSSNQISSVFGEHFRKAFLLSKSANSTNVDGLSAANEFRQGVDKLVQRILQSNSERQFVFDFIDGSSADELYTLIQKVSPTTDPRELRIIYEKAKASEPDVGSREFRDLARIAERVLPDQLRRMQDYPSHVRDTVYENVPEIRRLFDARQAFEAKRNDEIDFELAEIGLKRDDVPYLRDMKVGVDDAIDALYGETSKVESGPFVTSTDGFTKLAIKRLLAKAVEENYDGIGFSTGEVEVDRWGSTAEGLRPYYDEKIPAVLKKVAGKSADQKMEIDGYEVPYLLLDDKVGEKTLREKLSDPQTMFQITGAIATPGIVALGALSPEEAKAEERRAANFALDYPKQDKPGIAALSGQLALGAGTEIAGAIGGGLAGMLEYLRGNYMPEQYSSPENIRSVREGVGSLIGGLYDAGPEAQELGQEIMQNIGTAVSPVIDYALEGPITDERGLNLLPLVTQKLGVPAYETVKGVFEDLPEREQEAVISASDVYL